MNKYVLIVEDNKIECLKLSKALEASGYIPVVTNDGLTGLEACEKYQIDAALVDIQMPMMDGFSFLQRLEKMNLKRKVPIIMMTASKHETKHIMSALDLGAKDFIVKPIDVHILASKLKQVLKHEKSEWSERIINPAEFPNQAEVSIGLQVYSISEMNVAITSPAAIQKNALVKLNWEVFKQNEIDEVHLKVVDCISRDNGYLVYLTFLGLPETKLKKIRQLITKISLHNKKVSEI